MPLMVMEKLENLLLTQNFSSKELEEDYLRGSKLLSFNFKQQVCNDYEDHGLKKEYLQELNHFVLIKLILEKKMTRYLLIKNYICKYI